MLKTGLATGGFGVDTANSIKLIAEAGLDSFFTSVPGTHDDLVSYSKLAEKYGLMYSSLHAPFKNAAKMWMDGEKGDAAEAELVHSINECSSVSIPVLVVHPFIGFEDHNPTEIGLTRFKRLAELAEKKNVKLAIENVEGEEYLDYLLRGLTDYDSVGFCLDTGHMICYNHGRDFLSEYGDRLIYTHIDDNEGCTYPDGRIFWLDDAHLLPFDGVQDWENIARSIKKTGYTGPLTLELTKTSKPDRTCNDIYNSLSAEQYVFEAASRIKKLAEMVENA